MRHKQPNKNQSGFTILELVIVLAIIAIGLVAILPANTGRIDQARIAETISLVRPYQLQVEGHYRAHGEFPIDNKVIDMPAPEKIIGNYVEAAYLEKGAIHLQLGNKIRPELTGKILSLRPVFVPDADYAPVSWVCGYDTVPKNMLAAGTNRTDVALASLPLSCR